MMLVAVYVIATLTLAIVIAALAVAVNKRWQDEPPGGLDVDRLTPTERRKLWAAMDHERRRDVL
jgi:hypothetical protein